MNVIVENMRNVHCTFVSHLGKYLSNQTFTKSCYVGILCCNGHPYPICVSPITRVALRTLSTAPPLRPVDTTCVGDDESGGSKGDKRTPTDTSDVPAGSKGKNFGKGRGGGNNSHLSCPKCGDPCTHVETFVTSTRFVKCEKCHHFFVVLSEVDSKKTIKEQTKDEHRNSFVRKPPPPPKKIYAYLDKHVIGQEHAKKVLSVAVYNHYKRIYNNLSQSVNTNTKQDMTLVENGSQYSFPPKDFLHLNGFNSFNFGSGQATNGLGFQSNPEKSSPPNNGTAAGSNGSDILENNSHELQLEKSNILLLGPTGSGE